MSWCEEVTMKTVVLSIEGMMSICDGLGVEKRLLNYPGIHDIEANFLTGTATVKYDESKLTLEEIKKLISECSYHCSGEQVPAHISKPLDPPPDSHSAAAYKRRSSSATQLQLKEEVSPHTSSTTHKEVSTEHERHDKAPEMGSQQATAISHEMGHGGQMSMEEMVRDMRRRFIVALVLAIPVFIYSPLFTQVFKIQAPLPLGISNEVISFILTTPAVIYGGWVFYIGAWRALRNRVLNMAVLVSLSVLVGYLFSVGATFFFKSEVFYEAASLLLVFVLFGHLIEMRARAGTSQAH
jgi:Cu2+-exporting ATPase